MRLVIPNSASRGPAHALSTAAHAAVAALLSGCLLAPLPGHAELAASTVVMDRVARVVDGDTLVAERLEHPPQPRRRKDALAIVHYHVVVVRDAARADRLREEAGRGQHVWQARTVVRRVDVEKCRARNACEWRWRCSLSRSKAREGVT